MTPVAGQLRKALAGEPEGPSRRTESEQRQLRAEYEARMDSVDSGWRQRQEAALAVAEECRQRGAWVGDGNCRE